jgi:hypothetical protein
MTTTQNAKVNTSGIDWTAPATEVSDALLEAVQTAYPTLDWNAQMEMAEDLMLEGLR